MAATALPTKQRPPKRDIQAPSFFASFLSIEEQFIRFVCQAAERKRGSSNGVCRSFSSNSDNEEKGFITGGDKTETGVESVVPGCLTEERSGDINARSGAKSSRRAWAISD